MTEMERIVQVYCPKCHADPGQKCRDGEFGPEIEEVHAARIGRAKRTGMIHIELDPEHVKRLAAEDARGRKKNQ